MGQKQLTVSEKLLLAGFHLETLGHRPFSAEDLVVSAWQAFPDVFGLAGYQGANGSESYPDSNRVFAEIMGSKPIRKRGYLTKVGSKMYQLTPAGRDFALRLSGKSHGDNKKILLSRETKEDLKRLISSKAFEKVRNNRIDNLTFFDACTFWGISSRSSAIELQGKLASFEGIVDSARRVVTDTTSFEHGRLPFGSDDLEMLLKIHKILLDKFDEELRIISKRTDQRL
jgi:hypothetical protein